MNYSEAIGDGGYKRPHDLFPQEAYCLHVKVVQAKWNRKFSKIVWGGVEEFHGKFVL